MFSIMTAALLMTPTLAADNVPTIDFDVRKMDIPIRYDPARKANIALLRLYVSEDRGVTWQIHSTVTPLANCFSFEATKADLYSFAMVIVDLKGQTDPENIKALVPQYHVRVTTVAFKKSPDDFEAAQKFWQLVRVEGRSMVEQLTRTIDRYHMAMLKSELEELRGRIERLEKTQPK